MDELLILRSTTQSVATEAAGLSFRADPNSLRGFFENEGIWDFKDPKTLKL